MKFPEAPSFPKKQGNKRSKRKATISQSPKSKLKSGQQQQRAEGALALLLARHCADVMGYMAILCIMGLMFPACSPVDFVPLPCATASRAPPPPSPACSS